MTPNVISAEEALAQGSSWFHILSIAKFHSNAMRILKPKSFDRLPRHKQIAIERTILDTQRLVDAVRAVASEMRWSQEGKGLNG